MILFYWSDFFFFKPSSGSFTSICMHIAHIHWNNNMNNSIKISNQKREAVWYSPNNGLLLFTFQRCSFEQIVIDAMIGISKHASAVIDVDKFDLRFHLYCVLLFFCNGLYPSFLPKSSKINFNTTSCILIFVKKLIKFTSFPLIYDG